MNLADIVESSAETHADRIAVTDVRSGRAITYAALAREARQVAAFLRTAGVEPGQRIGLLCPNGLAYLPAAFGLLGTGACLVPVPTNVTAAEMTDLLREVDVNACLSAPGAAEGLPAGGAPQPLTGGECDGFTFSWVDRDAAGPDALRSLDPAFIRFTSGTTARSKGVVLSHAATLARVEAADHVLSFTPEDRILWVLPLAYHFAVTITAYVKAGAHILMAPDTLPRAVAEAIRRLQASVVYASPFHFERLGNLSPGEPLKSVRLALSTSAPITQAVMDRFEAGYGVPVAQAYGIIEAGLPCINVRTDGLPATSVGRPVPGYEVAVFAESGECVSAGVTGEIAVRGSGLFSAYYAPWQRREDITHDGWFLTGDIGRVDAAGALYLEGRKKAVIFVAGVKFFPEEVEACINRFPGVKESRVMGHPHPRLGQVPHAEVAVSSSSVDVGALRAHCTRLLSPYKVPVEFAIVSAIARTPGGKILRR
ncbi:MAG TPA: class I adenylate-forming enzyme family protein [Methylomirabilota bacterium]